MHRRVQNREAVAEHCASKGGMVACELLVIVGAQPLPSTDLEHHLRRRGSQQRPGVSTREKLERPDFPARRSPQLESLPAKLAVRAFVLNRRADSSIHEQ